MHRDQILRTARTLPYLPTAVYAAFASASTLATWWGPAGFTNTFQVFEFKVGGRWQFIMHGPDGKHYSNESIFEALEPGAKVVIRHVCPPHFTLTVRLKAVPGGTRLEWEQAFDELQVAQAVRHICEPANEQNLDRLEQALSQTAGPAT